MPYVTRHNADADQGFTVLEMAVAMVMFGVLSGFATTGWLHYTRAHELRSGVDQVTSLLRNAQERSLAEATTYCVSFGTDNRSYTLYKFTCDASGTMVGSTMKTPSANVLFGSASFTTSDGTQARAVTFTPRGSATPGRLTIRRGEGAKTYTISVEGLTGRVSVG